MLPLLLSALCVLGVISFFIYLVWHWTSLDAEQLKGMPTVLFYLGIIYFVLAPICMVVGLLQGNYVLTANGFVLFCTGFVYISIRNLNNEMSSVYTRLYALESEIQKLKNEVPNSQESISSKF